MRSNARNGTAGVALNNAADISVIAIYFVVVMVVGVWVSSFQLPFKSFFSVNTKHFNSFIVVRVALLK